MMNANFNLQAAAEQASKNYHASMAQLGLNTPIPESVRATAEKIVDKSREAYSRSNNALDASVATLERTFDAAGQGAVAFNRKIIDIAQRNVNSGFDLAKSLAGAKNLSEIVELQGTIGRSCWARSRRKPKKFARFRPKWRLPRASRSRSR